MSTIPETFLTDLPPDPEDIDDYPTPDIKKLNELSAEINDDLSMIRFDVWGDTPEALDFCESLIKHAIRVRKLVREQHAALEQWSAALTPPLALPAPQEAA